MDADRGVKELPLFPLDIVLFPHMQVPLHIFEERYRLMINRCIASGAPFGILLATGIDPDAHTVTTAPIGCSAQIRTVNRLEDGRLNIQIQGVSRFRVLDTHESEPYRTGIVAPVDDLPCDLDGLAPLATETGVLLGEYLTLQLARQGDEVGDLDLPEDPVALSFIAACVLPIDTRQKQNLLEQTDTAARLMIVRNLLRLVTNQLKDAPPVPQTVYEPMRPERFEPYVCLN